MPPFERFMRALTDGRVQASGLLVPSLVLHTLGAKSGEWRESALMYCPDVDPANMLVTGSNFARENHPGWTYNLLAHDKAWIELKGERIDVTAHLVGDDEREAIWAHIQDQWPNYRQYEVAAHRTLRIFRLVPRQTRPSARSSST